MNESTPRPAHSFPECQAANADQRSHMAYYDQEHELSICWNGGHHIDVSQGGYGESPIIEWRANSGWSRSTTTLEQFESQARLIVSLYASGRIPYSLYIETGDVLRKAESLGEEAGRAAASWVEDEDAAQIIKGIDEGDPAILDTLPAPLSGEWADDITEKDIFAEVGVAPDPFHPTDSDEVIEKWEEGFHFGFESELRARKDV